MLAYFHKLNGLFKQGQSAVNKGTAAVGLGLVVLLISQPASATLPIQSWQTKSGATVLFMRAEALPMVDVSIAFPAGTRADPENREGLASMVSNLLGTGANGMTENEIADGFADTGANFGAGASSDFASVSLRTLTTEPEYSKSVDLFAKVVQQPKFDAAILERELNRSLSGLKESLTKPDTIASRTLSEAMYPSHPYGRHVTEDSLKRLDIEFIRAFYQSRYLSNYAVVAIVGSLTREQAGALAEKMTSNMPQNTLGENPLGGMQYDALQAQMQGAQTVIAHPAAQAHIMLGLPAMKRGAADYFDLLVANHVIGGGGFTSRLMKEIREARGLAYSTYSYFQPLGDAGPYTAAVQTKKEQATEALDVMKNTLMEFIKNGPTPEELQAAKSNLIDGFPLRIDSNSELVSNLTMMGVYGMPLDYLDTWPEQIEQVTLQSAKQAFAKHVDPQKLVTVVVGPDAL